MCGHAPTPLSTVSAACASARSGPLLLICDYLSIRSDRAYIVGDPVTQPVRRIVQAVNGIAVWGPWYYYSHITVPLPCVGGCFLAPANFYYCSTPRSSPPPIRHTLSICKERSRRTSVERVVCFLYWMFGTFSFRCSWILIITLWSFLLCSIIMQRVVSTALWS